MRILVIEDNSDIAANIGDYLEEKGHVVDFAGDGVTGLHLAVVHDFDAIVLDLTCPAWMASSCAASCARTRAGRRRC
jgi:Response regulators consisting of a CheY-like receiver domain and a winged-helix DNA-binding domain